MRIHLIIFLLVSVEFGSGDYDCPVERCRKDGPVIEFPFRLKGRHSEHCGYPGFDLSCSQSNETLLELPFSAKASINKTKLPYTKKFIVKEINYLTQLITLSNVDGCLPGLLRELNLSASPFQLEGSDDYTFFTCPSPRQRYVPDMISIPCLSTSNHHVYAVRTYKSIYARTYKSLFGVYTYISLFDSTYETLYVTPLFSCSKMFTVSSLSFALLDDNIQFQLIWTKPACGYCQIKGNFCRLKNKGSLNETVCFPKILYRAFMRKDDSERSDFTEKLIIAGSVLGPSLGVIIAIVLHQVCCSRSLKKEDQLKIELFLEEYKALKPTRYSYEDLKRITANFTEKLGQGGYGTVYKGKLSNEVFVAVKVLDSSSGNGEEFINEVGTIGRIHHVNVVRLVGYCAEGSRRALVYEFLPNESLEKYVSSESRNPLLSWEKMQQIALGIAKGLEYLHQGCEQRILHFDIKPHNILLDQDFNPKVADFGLAKLCSKEESIVSMTAARGTMGYIAPEVFSRNFGNVSYKSDVYSFGMLLLEMVGARKNIGVGAQDTSQAYFPEWIYNKLNQGEEIAIQIERAGDTKIVRKLTVVGLWCIQWYPIDRPSMKRVVQMLEADDTPSMPQNPFGTTNRTETRASMKRRLFCSDLEIISESD